MKSSTIVFHRREAMPGTSGCLAAMAAILVGISGAMTIGRAQQPGYDEQGEEVLTRGPVSL